MCLKVGKIIMVIINIIFLIISSILIIVGAILQWGDKSVKDGIVNGISGLGGDQTLTFKDIAQITEQYIAVLGDAGLIIFIIGVILFFISGCGFIGICCSNKITLIIYIIILVLLLILMIIFIVVFLTKRDELKTSGYKSFYKILVDKYTFRSNYSSSSSEVSGIIDLIQIKLKCCGANNGTDYDNNKSKDKGNNKIPASCCITKSNTDFTPNDPKCTTAPTDRNSYTNEGCYPKLWFFIEKYSNYASYALIGLSCFKLILIIFACCFVRNLDSDKGERI